MLFGETNFKKFKRLVDKLFPEEPSARAVPFDPFHSGYQPNKSALKEPPTGGMMEQAVETRKYGDNNTIHNTNHLDVETDKYGNVVAVWFRCQHISFRQTKVGDSRAAELKSLYKDTDPKISAIDIVV